jgi:hypothetical protein
VLYQHRPRSPEGAEARGAAQRSDLHHAVDIVMMGPRISVHAYLLRCRPPPQLVQNVVWARLGAGAPDPVAAPPCTPQKSRPSWI